MKFTTYLSLMTLGASVAVARPLFRDNVVAERRHVPAPVVRRQEVASASAATAAPEASASAASEAPFSYSTITNTAGFAFSGSTYSLSSSVSTSATTETRLPQATASASGNGNVNRNMNEENTFSSSSFGDFNNNGLNGFNSFNSFGNSFNNGFNNGFNNFDISNTAVITIREVQTVTQFVAVQVPVFLGVQVNNGFRENLFSSQFSNLFQSRFDQWDINVINQLGFVLAQQYDFLTRAGNNGFQLFNNDVFNAFVGKFGSQFSVFDNFNLADVQQLLLLLQGFDLNQLSSFFGRSDLLFSQDIFNQFGINNNFNSFVTQLPQILVTIQNGAFNNDGFFNLGNLNHNTLNFLQVV